jgi:hypothetical protein
MSRWLSVVAACCDLPAVLADAPRDSAEVMLAYVHELAASSPRRVPFVCSVVDGWAQTSESLRCRIVDCGSEGFDGFTVGVIKRTEVSKRSQLRRKDLNWYAQSILLDGINTARGWAEFCGGEVILIEKCQGYTLTNEEYQSPL